ncbi:MAG TPA: hypothetical protein VKC66_33770 [Xanthobacteraceae bacterium]|nr:hypothetical protein [Xanthobacteraceae bacterium]
MINLQQHKVTVSPFRQSGNLFGEKSGRQTMRPASPAFVIIAMLLTVSLPNIEANSQPELPGPFPGLGAYSNLFNNICGKQGVKSERWNPKELPFIGCFGLSSGSSASGIVAGHQLELGVDEKGKEICKIDGTIVVRTDRHKTNIPNVLYGCDSLHFCADEDGRNCSTNLAVISRNSDRSIFFYFAQRIFGHTFVTNQENWDDYQQRKQKCPTEKPYC